MEDLFSMFNKSHGVASFAHRKHVVSLSNLNVVKSFIKEL